MAGPTDVFDGGASAVNELIDSSEDEMDTTTANAPLTPEVRVEDHDEFWIAPPFASAEDASGYPLLLEDQQVFTDHPAPSKAHGLNESDKPDGGPLTSTNSIFVSTTHEPVISQSKSQPPRKRTKVTLDPESLPDPDEELNEEQIALICLQPPKLRQRYRHYFSNAGILRAAYSKILSERLPSGEMRFSEDVRRSCLPKKRIRSDGLKLDDPSRSSVGQTRKRKEGEISLTGLNDKDIPTKKSRTLHQKLGRISQRDITSLSPILDTGTVHGRQMEPSTSHPKDPGTAQVADLDTHGPEPASETDGQRSSKPIAGQTPNKNKSAANRQGEHDSHPLERPTGSTPPDFAGSADQSEHELGLPQLLDPAFLECFSYFLTREVHRLDYAIFRAERDPATRKHADILRQHWLALVAFRDSCIRIEMEQISANASAED
ncbi:hypothetical protein POX_a01087 [Penicillium oxalicum]|uniref:hypothetical protein n=1 Tax=Penicillium oxalicum TaxID=69781 RepID=UPI0020B6A638|nr:hypothetical protein POX_a01087 [Penicillium oxalicum]KAI2794488.1 hypothetical protein POX_a01087 [Penicillium oxalicum]